jgi:hypothetical protein
MQNNRRFTAISLSNPCYFNLIFWLGSTPITLVSVLDLNGWSCCLELAETAAGSYGILQVAHFLLASLGKPGCLCNLVIRTLRRDLVAIVATSSVDSFWRLLVSKVSAQFPRQPAVIGGLIW